MKDIATGMLAATAENPRLLDPVRQVIQETLEQLQGHVGRPGCGLLAWLAVEGLNSFEMHDLSPFSDEDRERIVQADRRACSTKGIAE